MADEGKKNNNKAVIGAVALCVLLGAVVWLFSRPQKDAPQAGTLPAATSLGVIDVANAISDHPLYADYARRLARCRELTATIEKLRGMAADFAAPQPGDEPFDDAARQKHMQTMIRAFADLQEKLREVEAAYDEEHKPAYAAEKKAIDDEYLTEIFNIQLKLDNAKVMRLTEDTLAKLKDRLAALKRERGGRQLALKREYDAKRDSYMQEIKQRERQKLRIAAGDTLNDYRAFEMKREADALDRNVQTMGQLMAAEFERRAKIIDLGRELSLQKAEAVKLENRIRRDLESRTAKFAALYKLDIVLARDFNADSDNPLRPRKREGLGVIVRDGRDITAEVKEELRRVQIEKSVAKAANKN